MTDAQRARATAALTLTLLCLSQALAALLELLFLSRFYAGRIIVPVTIFAALAGNLLLPWWGYRVVGRLRGAALPVLSWLAPVLALTVYNRPEGDLFLLGAYYQDAAFYAFLLIGSVTGFATVVLLSGQPVNG